MTVASCTLTALLRDETWRLLKDGEHGQPG